MLQLKWSVICICGLLLLVQYAPAQNLVTNPGFSGTSTDPNYFIVGWRRTSNNATGLIDVSQSLTGGEGSTESLHLAVTGAAGASSTNNGAYQIIPVTNGKKYQIRGKWRGDFSMPAANGANAAIEVYAGFGNSATVRAASETMIYRKRVNYGVFTDNSVIFNYNNSMNVDPNALGWTWSQMSDSINLGWAGGDTVTATDSYMTLRVQMNTALQGGTEYVDFDNMQVVGCQGNIAGDINADCVVNMKDMATIANNWLTCGITASTVCW